MAVLAHTQTLRLSELSRRIADTISINFAHAYYWVIAEVSNHSYYPQKEHHYFELIEKEENGILAKMQAVAWRMGSARIKNFESVTGQKFKNGLKVCIRVQVEFHASFGLKLLVSDIDPSFTLGQLELQRQATLARLLSECASFVQKVGEEYITKNNRLAHARVIQRIAILSSSASAGFEDFMHTLLNNQFKYRFTLHHFFIAVQGESHADNICAKIEEISNSNVDFDAVVMIRGGGADTDFILFDQFALCRAVAQLDIPVITGIGHLKNQSLVDLLAHTSTNAPTKAAEFIIAHNRRFETALQDEQKRLVIKTQQLLQRYQQLVDRNNATLVRHARVVLSRNREEQQLLAEKIKNGSMRTLAKKENLLKEAGTKALHKPQLLIAFRKMALNNVANQLRSFPLKFIVAREKQLAYHDAACRMMDPANILKKGFALLYRENKILTKGETVSAGETLCVALQDSDITVTVTNKIMHDGEENDL